jgi:hypothetical protein
MDTEYVIDHFGVSFTTSGVVSLTAYRRVIPSAPAQASLVPTLQQQGIITKNTNVSVPNVRPVELFPYCANNLTDLATFYALDLQCQGLRHDRCACVDGEVHCIVATSSGGYVVPSTMVKWSDMATMKKGEMPQWCEDGEIADDYYLIQVRSPFNLVRLLSFEVAF